MSKPPDVVFQLRRMASPLPLPAGSIPPSQNTAPVHEHRCLYTHDVRRKAKRWQDGYLRFHTFNNRVMVYDVPRNFIGDTHYQDGGSDGLADGDELTLERTGILIQVGEKLETQQTDISGIVSKRVPKPIEGEAGTTSTINTGFRSQNSLQPRSNNIPSRSSARWTGWTGRAQIPQESPFTQKQAAANMEHHTEQTRPSKRQRRDDEHVPLWEILKTTKPARQVENQAQGRKDPMWVRTVDARAKASRSAALSKKNNIDGQPRLKVKEVIDITSSADEVHNGRIQARDAQTHGGVHNSSSSIKQAPERSRVGPIDRATLPPERNKISVANQLDPPQPKSPKSMMRAAEQRPSVVNPRMNQDHGSIRSGRNQAVRHDPKQNEATVVANPPPQYPREPSEVVHSISRRAPTTSLRPKQSARPAISPSALACNMSSYPSSPPVSTTNHLPPTENDHDTNLANKESRTNSREDLLPEAPMKPLRLTSAPPRKMLICESLSIVKPPPAPQRQRTSPVSISKSTHINPEQTTKPASKTSTSGRSESVTEAVDTNTLPLPSEFMDTPSSILHDIPLAKQTVPPQTAPARSNDETTTTTTITTTAQPPPQAQQQNRYKTNPPDYSHLDSLLLPDPPALNCPSIPQPLTHLTNVPLIPRVQANRPFRRYNSDTTHVSPTKPLQPLAAIPRLPPPTTIGMTGTTITTGPKKKTGPLRRAETIACTTSSRTATNVGQGQRAGQRAGQRGGQVEIGLGVGDRQEKREEKEQIGPWTKEAWDLFGWVPLGIDITL